MSRLPTVFFGHGSPAIALRQNEVTRSWNAIARSMERPRAILCVSAHWLTHGVGVTAQENPPTIHDFGGFPQAMFDIRYPAPGDTKLVRRVQSLLSPEPVIATDDWGYDHGCWTVLMKAWPDADIPVVQLSLDIGKSPAEHYALGLRLRPLRDEGVFIMGTGNIVHNLRLLRRVDGASPNPLAVEFSAAIKDAIERNDPQTVIDFAALGEAARFSVPTADHFLPLLYVLGARYPEDQPIFEPDFIEQCSIDMTTVTLRGDDAV